MNSSYGQEPAVGHRILLVNPNGNPVVTTLIRQAAARVLGPRCAAVAIQPDSSPISIETPDHRRLAEPLAVALLARNPGYDAYVMACFDDIAIEAGRGILSAPIIGAADASVAMARLFACRVAIVTTVETMVPGIHVLLGRLGAAKHCSVHAANVGVAAAAQSDGQADSRIDAAIERARQQDGAGAIILGSAGLAGRATDLAARHGLPVIDCIEAAILLAEAAARLHRRA